MSAAVFLHLDRLKLLMASLTTGTPLAAWEDIAEELEIA